MTNDYAVIDVETTMIKQGELPKTKFWGYADSNGYEYFKTTQGLLKFLRACEPKTLLHHSNFDILQMLVDGAANSIRIINSHNGRLLKCRIAEKHNTVNTYATFPVSLAKIFNAFGYGKTALSLLRKRNFEDCVNGLDCFTRLDDLFVRLTGVSPLETGTVAGTTFKAAQRIAGKLPKDTRFLEAYRGGRVEVYDTRRQRASKFDIHSSYPASILGAPNSVTLCYAKVKTKDFTCPFFDASQSDLLLFPNGVFYTWFFEENYEEFIAPWCRNTDIKIKSRERINLHWLTELKSLINEIYATKNSAVDEAVRLCCKFLLNAFYGRIGLRGETERARILDYRADGDGITCYYLGRKKWLVFDTLQRECKSNFPFAAYITDNARARLYRSFARNSPLYGDTDSIFTSVSKRNFSESISEHCGGWGYEGAKMFRAKSVKDYEWGDESVLKGGKDFTVWTLKRFAQGETPANVSRETKTALRKRFVLPDGTTIPHTVNNG